MGFSRQTNWSGLPFPFPKGTLERKKVKSLSHVRLLVTPWTASLPGSSAHGIFQARVLEWGAIAFSKRPVIETFKSCKGIILDFPGGPSGKERACQCRKHKRFGFDPWVRKIPWRRAWQPTPVFLPGESHGQRSLGGCSPWGRKKLDTTERLSTHAHMFILGKEQGRLWMELIARACWCSVKF